MVTIAVVSVTWVVMSGQKPVARPERSTITVPPVPVASSNVCASIDPIRGECSEWARPEPRSFQEVLRLDEQPQQPPNFKWSPLYLCSYPPDQLVEQFFGPGFRRAVVNGFVCSHESADPEDMVSIDVYVGNHSGGGGFEDWIDNSEQPEVIDFHGRRVLVDHGVGDSSSAFRSWIMEIPGSDRVIVLDYRDFPGFDANFELVPADREKADRAVEAFAEVYRKASE